MGASGCGKSSLLDILAGRPKLGDVSGEVRMVWEPVRGKRRRAQVRASIRNGDGGVDGKCIPDSLKA